MLFTWSAPDFFPISSVWTRSTTPMSDRLPAKLALRSFFSSRSFSFFSRRILTRVTISLM